MIETLWLVLLTAAVVYLFWRVSRPAPPLPPVEVPPERKPHPQSKVVRVHPRYLPVFIVLSLWPSLAQSQVKPLVRVPSNCTDAQVLGGQADGSGVECQTDAGIGGSTGSTDNAVLRADGAGGATAQSSSVFISDTPILGIGDSSSSAPGLGRRGATSQLEILTADGSARAITWASALYFNATAGNYSSNPLVMGDPGAAGPVLHLSSVSTLAWAASSTDGSQGKDTGLARDSAGVVEFTDGASGGGTWQAGDNGTRPTCDSSARGRYWHDFGGAGVADSISICAKDAADAYDWRVVY